LTSTNVKIERAREDAEAAVQHVKEDLKERIGEVDKYHGEAVEELNDKIEKVTKQSKESVKAKE